MKKVAATFLALSIGILNASSADAFGIQPTSSDPLSTETGDDLGSAPFLNSVLNLQRDVADASQSAEDALVDAVAGPLPQAVLANLSEGFNNVSDLAGKGWILQNNSDPPPLVPNTWAQGSTDQTSFVGQGDSNQFPNNFIQSDKPVTAGDAGGMNGIVSNWLITPELDFTNGGVVSFFARTISTQTIAEFLEVRQSNAGTDTGFSATPGANALGNFTKLIGTAGNLDGPADAEPNDIPFVSWKKYTFNVATGTNGRLAFRYFATDGGLNGTQAGYIGVDTVAYVANVPEPMSSSLAGFAALGLVSCLKRRRQAG
jgi:hypothetical protein